MAFSKILFAFAEISAPNFLSDTIIFMSFGDTRESNTANGKSFSLYLEGTESTGIIDAKFEIVVSDSLVNSDALCDDIKFRRLDSMLLLIVLYLAFIRLL